MSYFKTWVDHLLLLHRWSRNCYGFTLVEALVVSLIVAVLAAVAVPMYSGYVNNQRVEAAKNIAQSAAAAANIITRRTGSPPDCDAPDCTALLKIFISNPTQYEIEIEDRTVTVTDLLHTDIDPQIVDF